MKFEIDNHEGDFLDSVELPIDAVMALMYVTIH